MKVLYSWLKDYVDIDIEPKEEITFDDWMKLQFQRTLYSSYGILKKTKSYVDY